MIWFTRPSATCSWRPNTSPRAPPCCAHAHDEAGAWGVHVLGVEGRRQGPVEWESDRSRFLGRGRGPDNPIALDGRALSGTAGAVLDPIVSLRTRIPLASPALVRHRNGLEPRSRSGPGPEIPRPQRTRPDLRARPHPRADPTPTPGHLQ